MGNSIALCITSRFLCKESTIVKHQEVIKVVKTDGKILEFRNPILVKDLLLNFPNLGVSVSEQSSQHLPSNYELKIGKSYYLLPPSNSSKISTTATGRVSSTTNDIDEEQASGIKRIKVVITKQQLQELLSNRISVEELLSGIDREKCSKAAIVSSINWKPKLESIPEGSE